MSKFQITKQESFTITKKGDSSVYVGLSPLEAEQLYHDLREALGKDKEQNNILWSVGDVIEPESKEPDLPIGSQIRDHSTYRDIAELTEDGWIWRKLLGSTATDQNHWRWDRWSEQRWTVMRVGK